jgi:hypothetical protein
MQIIHYFLVFIWDKMFRKFPILIAAYAFFVTILLRLFVMM